jgi:hypothetical protein
VRLTLPERKAITRKLATRYEKAPKAEKSKILDEVCELCEWNRDHARRALKRALSPSPKPKRRVRVPTYDAEVISALEFVWSSLDGPAGKRLAPVMRSTLEALERHGEIHPCDRVRADLLKMSAATIDRRLGPQRKRLRIKGRSSTKPGALLKSQIPIRTFAEWDDAAPGFCEADLVSHDGGDPRGDHAFTLDVTCVATGWTEVRILRNRAQRWVIEALSDIETALPFPLIGLDTDNGGEFINHLLMEFCQQRTITFTRSRPYRKNDGCFVEQKNNSVVRRAVGYARYDTEAERDTLKELYGYLSDYVNFFQAQMRLVSKTRTGARVTKRYDRAATPFARLLGSGALEEEAASLLMKHYEALNPAELKRKIGGCQDRLIELARIPRPPLKGAKATHGWHTYSGRGFTPRRGTSG